jgi:hypothetical protein
MRYTKEQAQMLALLVIMGCAVVVLSFLYLVKPNFAAAAKSRKELKKTEAEIGTLNHAPVALAKAKKEMESLTATVDQGEKAVFGGMELVSPLSQICVQAGTMANVRPAYGEQTTTQLLDFAERGDNPAGAGQTKHYDEVSRTLDIRSADFFALCRFLTAVEGANPGLRVTGLKMDSTTLDDQSQSQGKVNANLELSLMGVREGQAPEPSGVVVDAAAFDFGENRNPFGPPSGTAGPADNPLVRCKEALRRMKVHGVMADWLLIEVPGRTPTGQPTTQRLKLTKGQTAVIGGTKMKYVQGSGDSFVFEATGEGVRFTVETNYKGEVTTIKEEEVQ